MGIEIRKAELSDIPAIIDLMTEFAEYERLSEHLEITAERLSAAMFGPRAFVEGLISILDGRPAGYAIFYPNFLTFRGQKGYFLEDIFVSEPARGHGLGEKMLREIARLGASRGFERLDLLVLEWNEAAISFYRKLGAHRNEEEQHFKFTDDAFKRLCS